MKNVSIFKDDWISKVGRWLFSIHSFIVFNTYLKLKIAGKQHLPTGPFIICSNHQSHLDAIILGHIGAFYFSKSALIAAKDYWYDNRKRFHLGSLFFNILPINRKENAHSFGMLEAVKTARAFFEGKGRCIVILPEGTRSASGTIKAFKKGVTTLARACEVPVVPVYIENSGNYWPKGSFFIRPGRLRVVIGKPLDHENLEATMIRETVLSLAKE